MYEFIDSYPLPLVGLDKEGRLAQLVRAPR